MTAHASDHLRRHGIQVTIRAQQPGYMDTPEGVGAYFLDPDANLIVAVVSAITTLNP